MRDSAELNRSLTRFQEWFTHDYAPRKVKEVGDYSKKRIRRPWKAVRAGQSIKTFSYVDYDEDISLALAGYFNRRSAEEAQTNTRVFPHRPYDPVKFGQFTFVPPRHTARKIAKIFVDFFKPYKGRDQLIQDYKQPLVGTANFFVGIGKFFAGIVKRQPRLVGDGTFTVLRALIELATTPLVWLIKPMTRGIATLIKKPVAIEKSSSLYRLANLGQESLKTVSDATSTPQKLHELFAIAADLHRKYSKSVQRKRKTQIELEEYTRYQELTQNAMIGDSNQTATKASLHRYFSLFKPSIQIEAQPEVLMDTAMPSINRHQ